MEPPAEKMYQTESESSESSDSDAEEKANFFELWKFFENDCRKILRSLLENYFSSYAVLVEKIPREAYTSENSNGIISEEDQRLIGNESAISKKFSFELLCNIFESSVCDEYCGRPSVGWRSKEESTISNFQNTGDDILQLVLLYRQYLSRNKEREISNRDNQMIWSTLRDVAGRLSNTCPKIGKKFLKRIEKDVTGRATVNNQIGFKNSIQHISSEDATETIVCNQLGQENRFSSRNAVQRAPKTFVINQQGENCKIAITLVDQIKGKSSLNIEGKDVRLTLHSPGKGFKEIAANIGNSSISDINEDRRLQEYSVEVVSTRNACLIVDVRITASKVDLSLRMERLVECLMSHSNAFQVLHDNNVDRLDIFGYYYQPCDYLDKSDLRLNFVLYSHVTLKLGKTIGDVDVFVSDSLKQMIEDSFKTDVDENIRVQIKGEIIEPKNISFTDIQTVIDHEDFSTSMNVSLATDCHLQIVDILRRKTATHVILKTVACLTYGRLVQNKGPIVVLLQKILQLNNVAEMLSDISFCRIGVLINTSMDEEFDKNDEKGIVFYLSPGSKIAEVMEDGKFPELVQALLGENNTKDIEQLKVKAVLEYDNGRNNSDSDPAIDITEEYERPTPEENISRNLQLALSYLNSGNLIEAKTLARSVFHEVADEDKDVFNQLKDIFEECADKFYALKCFCKVRLLENNKIFLWGPLFPLLLSREYWINVIHGPYEPKEIQKLFKEIEDMVFDYTDNDEYNGVAGCICLELLLSYRELANLHCEEDNTYIIKRIEIVNFHQCNILFRRGWYSNICDIYKQLDRDGFDLDVDSLYIWASSLKHLGKTDVALKKIEEAMDNLKRNVTMTSRNCSLDDLKELRESLMCEINQISKAQTNIDFEWLAGTNISIPQHMMEKAKIVKERHVKRSHRRPKKHREDISKLPTKEEATDRAIQSEDPSKYRTWKDVPPSVPELPEKIKTRKRRVVKLEEENDFNVVEIVERENSDESDSGQESYSESEEIQGKPFYYEAPEYRHSIETESEMYSDSGFDTFDDESQFENEHSESGYKVPSSTELVVSGITISDRCEISLQRKLKTETFKYDQGNLSKDELINRLQCDKIRYKKCIVEIESAHTAVCTNMDLGDDLKEIIISGRSKCGKAFTGDEVVVEILGESKAQKNYIPRLKLDAAKVSEDMNIYGKVIGTLKRNRYEDLEHPVLICAMDDFSVHSMKPLCKTVPKINVYHKNCEHKYQVDLFSYDVKRNVVEYRETLNIIQDHKNAYCFLVALINWDDMYPFGVVLKVINTKGDLRSGLMILKLQHRVPCQYSKDAADATKLILQRKQKNDPSNKKVVKGFTINLGQQGALETAYSVTLLESGLYRIGIHVVDPTSVIKKGDAIDKEAKRRGTDFYVNKDVPPVYMVPEGLRNTLFNMEPGKQRETLTVFFDVSIDLISGSIPEHFEIVEKIGRPIVKCESQYTIDEVQTLLKTKRNKSEISILYVISNYLRNKRLNNGSFFTDINEMFPYEKNNFIECFDAHLLVNELHFFANEAVAKFLFDKYPNCVPCKHHMPPSEKTLLKWKKSTEENLDKILFRLQDCKVAAENLSVFKCNPGKITDRNLIPIQNNVWKSMQEAAKLKQSDKLRLVMGADEIHPKQALCLEEWIAVQETSEFKCSSPRNENKHFGLRVPIFTIFTAPLSRYINLVVHRMVHAAIDKKTEPPYTKEEIQTLCMEMNKVENIRKEFRKSCLVFLFAHTLQLNPRVFNGFIQNVTNNDVELFFPTLRTLPRLSKILPLNLLKFKDNPEFQKEVGIDRFFMTLKWKNRIYSLRRETKNPPNENFLRIDPNQNVQFHHLQKWINIIQDFFKGNTKNMYSMLKNAPASNQHVPACFNTVNDVSSEVRGGGTFAQQTCSYSLSFIYGQLLVIQMCAESQRGILTPMPQLLDITPNVKICLHHTRDPLGVLTSRTTKPAKPGKYISPKQYIDTWMPIFSMEVATQTVSYDSFTINDLPITFRKEGGAFSLKYSFLERRDIEFTSHSTDLLSIDENNAENKRFYMSGSDFLCIRCPLEPLNDIVSNFGNGAISPFKRYWIGHAKVHDVKYKKKKNEKVVRVVFVCHNKSPPIPQEMLNKKRECSVEILPKSDVYRRTELYVKWLDSASVLAKAIALRKLPPDLDKKHKELGAKLVPQTDVLETGLVYNENQRKAIQKALTSSFSLIQGPPGTGKTLTGVALIKLFCNINQEYLKLNAGNKHFVLYCGPSNKSVDLVTVHLKKSCGDYKILRVYGGALESKEFPIPGKVYSVSHSDSAPDESLRDVSLHHIIRKPGNRYAEKITDFDRKFKNEKKIDFLEVKEYKRFIAKAVKEEIPKYDVILCTTSVATSSRLMSATSKTIYQLLIDEAGMCTEPESIATIVATQAKQVVLIGDHKQLQPVVLCQEAENLGLQKSLFERYAESDISEKVLTLLTNQYRMHPSLCRFPSYAFYDKQLVTKKSPKWEVLEPLSIWRDPKNPLVFCHTEGEEEYLANVSEEGNLMSKFNTAEIDLVERVYKALIKKERVSPENINIMSQYNAQCSKIKERLKKHVQNVNTVVASQGGEWDYVIFSLVRSLPEYRIEPNPTDGWRKENLGFINDDHQINVALTRARKGLIIIGNKRLMKCNVIFNKLLEDYGRHGCLEDAENFPPKQKRKK